MWAINKWCERCDEERAEYHVKWVEPMNRYIYDISRETYVRDVCLECYRWHIEQLNNGTHYKLETRPLIGNVTTIHTAQQSA